MAQEIADSKLIDTWSSSGTKIEPDISKIIEGWQLGEQPPHEYMNWLQNTFGSKLNHILKNGVAKWNNETEYLAGATIQHNGSIWICQETNVNSEPTDSNNNWDKIPSIENLALTVDTIDDFPSGATTGDTCIVKDLDRGGIFIYDSTKIAESNGGTIFNGWVRQFSGNIKADWFDNTTKNCVLRAIAALPASGGAVELSSIRYKPNDTNVTTLCMSKNNVRLIGSKMPYFSDNCDRLEGGTVIEGRFNVYADNFSHENIGYDNGAYVKSLYYAALDHTTASFPNGGTWDAFAFGQPNSVTPLPQAKGFKANNVIGLCVDSTALGHAMLMESIIYANIGTVIGMYSTHPMVFKAEKTTVDHVEGYGGGEEHVIIKADSYANCSEMTIGTIIADAFPENLTPHTPPAYPFAGLYIYSATSNVAYIRMGKVSIRGAESAYYFNGGSVDNFVDNIHIDELTVNGDGLAGSIGINANSDIKFYRVHINKAIINRTVDAVMVKNQAEGGGFVPSAFVIKTLIIDTCSLRALQLQGYASIIVDNYILRGAIANMYHIADTARAYIGKERIEGAISTNKWYSLPILIASGWQQYGGNAAFDIYLENYGVRVGGLLRMVSNENAVVCNLPAFLRPTAPTRLPIVAKGTTSGVNTVVAECAPSIDTLLLNGGVHLPVTQVDTWLSLDGLYWSIG